MAEGGGANGWLIKVGNRMRAMGGMSPIQRRRPANQNIKMSSMSAPTERRQVQVTVDGSMFGKDIAAAVDADGINKFVKWCVAAILETGEGLDTDDLYRASGGQEEISRIQEQPESVIEEALKRETNIHVLTGALKLFFRSLLRPILRLEDFKHVLEDDHQRLSQVIASQPSAVSSTLAFFLQHLQEVLQHPDNHMDARSLSVVFGPTLIRASRKNSDLTSMAAEMAAQSRLFEVLLDHSDNVFHEPAARESLSVTSTLTTRGSARTTNHHSSSETHDAATDALVTLSDSAGQPTNGRESPIHSNTNKDGNDDDDWELPTDTIPTSAIRRHAVTRLSTIETTVKLNVPTAL